MIEFVNSHPNVLLALEIIYVIFIVLLSVKIVMDTKNVSKTLAYLLLIIFIPVAGVVIYFFFGVNYRKNKFYNFKIEHNEELFRRVQHLIAEYHEHVVAALMTRREQFRNTINFLFRDSHSPLTQGNHVEVLVNGEEKFPKVIEVLKQAKHHIHFEYYIYDNDKIGNQLARILIDKAQKGVIVRFLYDDFGSSKIGKGLLQQLKNGGVQVSPVNKIRFKLFANHMNYRDHRKIIIVDGEHVFSGGINVSDNYINPRPKGVWRDTHFYLRGNGAFYFQYLFLTNWMFAVQENVKNIRDYFYENAKEYGHKMVQVAASGPDIKPYIKLSTTSSIYEAKHRIYITTPYFIPVESVLNALKSQVMAGVDVRLLVPKKGDSKLVNAAAYSYYEELLKDGVRIYFYEKGFVHAKTMLIDDNFSCIGTANMDVRSQELNFEVNTMIYDQAINQKLYDVFLSDIEESTEITYKNWQERPKIKVFFEYLARLLSPLL